MLKQDKKIKLSYDQLRIKSEINFIEYNLVNHKLYSKEDREELKERLEFLNNILYRV